MNFELLQVIKVGNRLGEGVQWDVQRQSIWWTDIQAARLYRFHWRAQELEYYELPERLCAFALTSDPNIIVAAFASGFARYELDSRACQWIDRPEFHFKGTRFNDGRVDRQGRFWCGTMIESDQATDSNGNLVKGSLYCLQGKSAICKLRDIRIANSLCWSKDGTTAYFADSPEQTIWAFDFDPAGANLSNRRVFARTAGNAVPDGSCVDHEDCLWNAEWGGGRVTRYRPDGSIDLQLDLPVSQPTCVAFGGPNLDCLIVTSATDQLSAEQAASQPEAGHVFVYKTPAKGLEEHKMRSI